MSRALFLNGATVMTTPTPRQLEVARATGYQGIEARAERLLGDPAEVVATAARVQPGEVWSLNGVRLSLGAEGAMDRDSLAADLPPRLRVCRALGVSYLLAVPPRLPGLEAAAAMAGTRDALALARDEAARAGVRIAFEFLGFGDCPINTPALAAETVLGVDGVDLVLDSCHWHAGGDGPLREFPVDRVAMVHLNDAPDKPRRAIEDADRVLPLEGVIRLRELLRDLAERGYAGPFSLETFNPAYWEEDPAAVASRGRAALTRLFAP